jgi:cAMP-dependent protein kinase regulator
MGCAASKENDKVNFDELDQLRARQKKEEASAAAPKKTGKRTIDAVQYNNNNNNNKFEPGTALIQNAQPVLDRIVSSAPKLANQVLVTANIARGAPTLVNKGAHHLKNVFAAPLEDIQSFQSPVFSKSQDEKTFIREALKNSFVFAALSEREMRTIIDAFKAMEVSTNDMIIQQGDVGDYFYVIREGTVRYEVDGNVVGHAGKGKTFGELSLLYNTSPRAASVIAESPTKVYRIDQKTFRYIMQSQTLQTENDKKDLLQGVVFLQDLDPTDINKLVHTMTPRVFEAGEYIVRKGEEGDTFYVIQEGKVRVTDITIGSTNYEDQTLGPGEYFGERALVTKEPRTANCIGKTKGIALSIGKDTFEKVVGKLAFLTMKSEDRRKLVRP